MSFFIPYCLKITTDKTADMAEESRESDPACLNKRMKQMKQTVLKPEQQ